MSKEIAEKLGVEESALQGYKIFTQEDFDSLSNNLTNQGQELKEKYQAEGREAGLEIALKQLKEKLGLDYSGRKNLDNMVNAINKKIADETSDVNVEEYTKKISDLSKALEDNSKEFEAFKNEVSIKENNRVVSDAMLKEFSKYSGKTSLDVEDLMTLYSAKNNVQFDGESIKIYNGSEIVKDNLLNPMTIQDSISSFVEGSYLTDNKPTGGRGEGDSKAGSKMTMEKLEASLVNQGMNKGSMEFNQKIVEAVQNGIVD